MSLPVNTHYTLNKYFSNIKLKNAGGNPEFISVRQVQSYLCKPKLCIGECAIPFLKLSHTKNLQIHTAAGCQITH